MPDRDHARSAAPAEREPGPVASTAPRGSVAGPALTADGLVSLQRSAGNAAVTQLVETHRTAPAATLQREAPAATEQQATGKIAQIREMLSRFNPPEQEIITTMGTLSPDEANTVLDDADLKAKAVGCFTDREMYRAVKAMKGDPAKARLWLEAEGLAKYTFVKTAATELDGVKLDPALDAQVTALVQHLIDNYMVTGDVVFNGIGGVRSPRTAHKNSTAYEIRKGTVSLEALKALEGGKDLDGNVWYEDGWTEAEAKAKAERVWDGPEAHEGYPVGDRRRLPNGLEAPKMSEHCTGEAMDVTIPWRDGDGWHAEANELVKRFGLARPIAAERWHFELAGGATP
jgi:hypothetical protein